MDHCENDMTEWQTGINRAFGRMYFAIYSVDLVCGFYLEISTLEIFKEHIPPREKNQLLFDMVVKYYVSEGYQDGMREFLNMDTIQDRLTEQNAVSHEFFGTTQGWCRASLVVEKRDEAGKVLRFAYVTQEINEEVKTEQERIAELKRAYEEVERANQSKSDFLFQMSHDIRTPLNAIIGFEHLIENCADRPDKVKEYARKIRVSGNLLLSFLNEILDMTKTERGETALNKDHFRLDELMEELALVIRSQTEQKGQHFSVEYLDISQERFLGDRVRISRVLFNILGNAARYTDEGGSIVFSVTEEEPDSQGRQNLIFRIRDTGIGMKPEILEQIFDPSNDSGNGGGKTCAFPAAGRGLPIAKRFTELMGGTIAIKSAAGRGTEVTVTVPFSADAEEETVPESPEYRPGRKGDILSGLHMLIVEDNHMNMEIITGILGLADVCCDRAYCGQDAVEQFARSEEGAYDVIIMDVCMPGMDGYETTRRIRSLPRPDASSVPVIALTANAFEDDIRNSQKAGMNAHLAKPLNMSLFRGTVKGLLEQRGKPGGSFCPGAGNC